MYAPGGRYESEAEQQEAEEVNRKIEAELLQERRAEEKANNVKESDARIDKSHTSFLKLLNLYRY